MEKEEIIKKANKFLACNIVQFKLLHSKDYFEGQEDGVEFMKYRFIEFIEELTGENFNDKRTM